MNRNYILLFLFSLMMTVSGLASLPPIDRDESRFVQATKQMAETGDYVDIRFQDASRYQKPVGIYWLQSAAVKLSGKGRKRRSGSTAGLGTGHRHRRRCDRLDRGQSFRRQCRDRCRPRDGGDLCHSLRGPRRQDRCDAAGLLRSSTRRAGADLSGVAPQRSRRRPSPVDILDRARRGNPHQGPDRAAAVGVDGAHPGCVRTRLALAVEAESRDVGWFWCC